MTPEQRIAHIFEDSLQTINKAADVIGPAIEEAAEKMIQSLLQGGKILACGNGGSAADAQHFSSEMLNRFEQERPPLPAIALSTDTSTLTAIANDYSYDDIFAKQVHGLGQPRDILLVITTSGNSENLCRAVVAAHEKEMHCIALNGKNGGDLSKLLSSGDVNVLAPGGSTARIQEVHGIVIHCLCDLIDRRLLGIHE